MACFSSANASWLLGCRRKSSPRWAETFSTVVSVSRGMVRWIAHSWSGVSAWSMSITRRLVPPGAGALRLQPVGGGVPVVAVGDHRADVPRASSSAACTSGSVIRQIRCSWSARSV